MEKFKLQEDLIQQMTHEFERINKSDCEMNIEVPMHLQMGPFNERFSYFVAIRIGYKNMSSLTWKLLQFEKYTPSYHIGAYDYVNLSVH